MHKEWDFTQVLGKMELLEFQENGRDWKVLNEVVYSQEDKNHMLSHEWILTINVCVHANEGLWEGT